MRFPFLADHLVEIEIAILNVGREARFTGGYVLADTCLDVLIAPALGEPISRSMGTR